MQHVLIYLLSVRLSYVKIIMFSCLYANRWVPTLTSDDVADRIIVAIQNKAKLAVIPGYLQIMLCAKW